jgi:hypothetical protein
MKKVYLLLGFVFLLTSCVEDVDFNMEGQEFLVGKWTNLEFSESGFSMEKTNNIPPNTYGFVFNSNGTLVHRANSSFCGTPPISTQDFSGKWTVIGDLILIEVAFWGGTNLQEWKVTHTTDNKVQVEFIKNEYKE